MPYAKKDYPIIPRLLADLTSDETITVFLATLTDAEIDYLYSNESLTVNGKSYASPLHWLVYSEAWVSLTLLFQYATKTSQHLDIDTKNNDDKKADLSMSTQRFSRLFTSVLVKKQNEDEALVVEIARGDAYCFSTLMRLLNPIHYVDFAILAFYATEKFFLQMLAAIPADAINKLCQFPNKDEYKLRDSEADYYNDEKDNNCVLIPFFNLVCENQPEENIAALIDKLNDKTLNIIMSRSGANGFFCFMQNVTSPDIYLKLLTRLEKRTLNLMALQVEEGKLAFEYFLGLSPNKSKLSDVFSFFLLQLNNVTLHTCLGDSSSSPTTARVADAKIIMADILARWEWNFWRKGEKPTILELFVYIRPYADIEFLIKKMSPFIFPRDQDGHPVNLSHFSHNHNNHLHAEEKAKIFNLLHKVSQLNSFDFNSFSYHYSRDRILELINPYLSGEDIVLELPQWNDLILKWPSTEKNFHNKISILLAKSILKHYSLEPTTHVTWMLRAYGLLANLIDYTPNEIEGYFIGYNLTTGGSRYDDENALQSLPSTFVLALAAFESSHLAFKDGLLNLKAAAYPLEKKSINIDTKSQDIKGLAASNLDIKVSTTIALDSDDKINKKNTDSENAKILLINYAFSDDKDHKDILSISEQDLNANLAKKIHELEAKHATLKDIGWTYIGKLFKTMWSGVYNEAQQYLNKLARHKLQFEMAPDYSAQRLAVLVEMGDALEVELSNVNKKLVPDINGVLFPENLNKYQTHLKSLKDILNLVLFKSHHLSVFSLLKMDFNSRYMEQLKRQFNESFKFILSPELTTQKSITDFLFFSSQYIKTKDNIILDAPDWIPVLNQALASVKAENKLAHDRLNVLLARVNAASAKNNENLRYSIAIYSALNTLTEIKNLDKSDNAFAGGILTQYINCYQDSKNLNNISPHTAVALAQFDDFHQLNLKGLQHLQAASLDEKNAVPLDQKLLNILQEKQQAINKISWSSFNKQFKGLFADPLLKNLPEVKKMLPNLAKLKIEFELKITDKKAQPELLLNSMKKLIATSVPKIKSVGIFSSATPFQEWADTTLNVLKDIETKLAIENSHQAPQKNK